MYAEIVGTLRPGYVVKLCPSSGDVIKSESVIISSVYMDDQPRNFYFTEVSKECNYFTF